jgi:RNA polymerase sigma-70 factor (ECF subfamily)
MASPLTVSARTEAFLSVMEAHKGILYKVAHSYCRDEEDRRDLVQEIILQVWKSFDQYDPAYRYSTWIYRIALNVAISFYRKTKSRQERAQQYREEIVYLGEAQLSEREQEQQVLLDHLIRELPELDRAILLLYLDQASQREIAAVMGISETNVSTRISRIKKNLAERIKHFQK